MLKDSKVINKEFEESIEKAKALLKNSPKVEALCKEAMEKLKKAKQDEYLKYLPLMVECVNSYVKGEYKAIPTKSILAILGAVIYFAAPADLIPDRIPIIGRLDDSAVIAKALKLVSMDLDKYAEWQNRQSSEDNVIDEEKGN